MGLSAGEGTYRKCDFTTSASSMSALTVQYPVKTMASLLDIANKLAAILPDVKRGALRFWGDWLGRPFDNGHLLVECEASDDCLRLRFNEGRGSGSVESHGRTNQRNNLPHWECHRAAIDLVLLWPSEDAGKPVLP
jgi:hypothetical protein